MKWIQVFALLALTSVVGKAERIIDLENPGFEKGLDGWDKTDDAGMSQAAPEAIHDGALGLRITDTDAKAGSSLATSKFQVTPGKTYQARFWSRVVSGEGMGVYIQFFDSAGKLIGSTQELQIKYDLLPLILPVGQREWKEFLTRKAAPEGAVEGRIWIHSFISAQVTADFDDFHLVEMD